MENFDETTYYRYCRTLDGRLEPVDLIRRNGRLVPRFTPRSHEVEPSLWELRRLLRELTYNLNRLERRTWGALLRGKSIVEVARKEGVTPSAIYERIRGSSKGHGGMIRKNDYVLIWWRAQQVKK